MLRYLLSAAILITLVACQDKAAETEAYAAEVMKVHDIAMADYTRLNLMKAELQNQLDDSLVTEPALRDQMNNIILALGTANRDMMEWMVSYNPDTYKGEPEKRMEYLREEMQKIEDVKQGMMSAKERAQPYIDMKAIKAYDGSQDVIDTDDHDGHDHGHGDHDHDHDHSGHDH